MEGVLRVLAFAAVWGCGRIAFDPHACEGPSCGVQCEAGCFPLTLYRDSLEPLDWGHAVAALPTGEVHVLFIDPRTGAAMWQYSDATLRHWSMPIDLAEGATRMFTSVELVRHADRSLTALVLDYSATGSTMYRRLLAPTAPSTWMATEPLDIVPLPSVLGPGLFSAGANASGTGGVIAFVSDGNDTQINSVYAARSDDKFRTLQGLATGAPWDIVTTSAAPAFYFELRAMIDGKDEAWLVFHQRTGTLDNAVLARPFAGSWQQALPGWGDPWHLGAAVDGSDVLHVLLQQEGTTGNPQHATATTLNTTSGAASIGTWNWASLPTNANLRSELAVDGNALRALWEDPETSTIATRGYDGTTWAAIVPDVVGRVNIASTALGAALVVAPQMVNGTTHMVWRDAVDLGGGNLEYTMAYVPFTMCGAAMCAFDQACVSNACTPR